MNATDIERILRRKCGHVFLGVFAKDRLPASLPAKRPLLLVCNTDPHQRPGEHWVVLYIGRNARGEYFDSFGRAPDRLFKLYLDKYCSVWKRNERQIQSVLTRFCGHYCIFFCLYKYMDYDLKTIINCFSNDTGLNDWIVHKFVCESI
jgi:hypothetical protein